MESHRQNCIHRWVLSEPRLGKVLGVCRRCGARRRYPSGLELPEAIPTYEELESGVPALAVDAAPVEEVSPV